jgi:hypothetical protein
MPYPRKGVYSTVARTECPPAWARQRELSQISLALFLHSARTSFAMTAAPDFALAGSTIASAHTKNSSKIIVNDKTVNTRRGAHFNARALGKQIRELQRGVERPRTSLFVTEQFGSKGWSLTARVTARSGATTIAGEQEHGGSGH